MNILGCKRPAGVAARWRWAVWVLLGLLVVAHGCHGDRDTELFARGGSVARQK
jgi:hypothetical protein